MIKRFLDGYFRLCVLAGFLFALGAWAGMGLALYCAPAFVTAYFFIQEGEGQAAAGAFIVTLFVTGLLSIYLSPLDRVVRFFHAGIRRLSDGWISMLEQDMNSD